MPNFSHSRIKTFESCPLKYKFNYIDQVEVEIENTVEAFLGDMVHRTLKKLYEELQIGTLNSMQDLLIYFAKEWNENWNENIKINKTEFLEQDYKKMGEAFIIDYYNHYKPFDQNQVIGLETEELLNLDDKDHYKFHIRIDRLDYTGDGVYEIHDYKTSGFLQKQEYFEQDWQLAMYALWVKGHFKDAKEVRLIWHYLAFDKEMESGRTFEQLEKLRKEVIEKIKLIESESDFLPKVSKLCDYCIYQEICPVWK